MKRETKAMAGLRTFREYAEHSGISYEAVRKKVETHLKNYQANRERIEKALEVARKHYAEAGEMLDSATAENADPEEISKCEMAVRSCEAEYNSLQEELKALEGFYNGVTTDTAGTKYLNESAQAYLDGKKRETVVTVPDRDSKAALKVVNEENEALRRQILKLQEALLTERTNKLEELRTEDRTGAEDRAARLEALEEKAKQLEQSIDQITEAQKRIQETIESIQLTEKADFDRLTERLDNLYTEVLKSRKRGLFGRHRED